MTRNKLAQYELLAVLFTRKDKINLDKIPKLRNLFKEFNHPSQPGFDSVIKCSNKKNTEATETELREHKFIADKNNIQLTVSMRQMLFVCHM